jgi:hypothetical protein
MKKPKKNGAEEVDEHNQTTEPFDFGVSPYAPTVTADRLPPETPPIAMVRAAPPRPGQAPLIGAYPFLPPSPVRQNGQGAVPAGSVVVPPAADVKEPAPAGRRVRKVFPALVGLCFVVIQVLLLVSFVCKIVGQWDSTLWVNVLYVISDILVWPVQTVVHQLPTPIVIPAQIVMLLTILIYGIVSRIVVRSLKFLLHSSKA